MANDATVVDPEGHKVVIDNDVVRILEVKVNAGKVIPEHSHPRRAIIAVSNYRLRSTEAGRSQVVDRSPGDVVWSEGEVHTAEVLEGPVHAIEVEVKC